MPKVWRFQVEYAFRFGVIAPARCAVRPGARQPPLAVTAGLDPNRNSATGSGLGC
jgi:hypothetical protein